MAQLGYTPLLLYRSGTPAAVPLAANLNYGELAINYADGKLYYKNVSNVVTQFTGGGVTSFQTNLSGLTPSTSTTGAVTLSGTLGATSGGTSFSTYTTGDVIYSSASNTLAKLGIGTSGQVLTVSVGGVPTWSTITGTGTVTSVNVSGGTTGLTASGGPITASGTITLAGTLIAVNGGTGITSYAQGEMLYANTSTTLDKVTANTTVNKRFLTQTGNGTVGLAPAWSTLTASDISGTLGIASGGTGQTTAGAAFNALSPITSIGDLIIGNGVNSATRLAIGTNNYVLTSNGTTAVWAAAGSAGVASITFGSTGLTPSTASAGAITVAGTLNVANGGTGVTTSTGTGSVVLNSAPSLTNPTVTEYTETNFSPAAGTAFTINLANGTFQNISLNGNGTITLPSSVAGKSFVIKVTYSGAFSLNWTGGSTLKWPGGTAPTATSASGKFDMFAFFCDGTNTYGQSIGLNY